MKKILVIILSVIMVIVSCAACKPNSPDLSSIDSALLSSQDVTTALSESTGSDETSTVTSESIASTESTTSTANSASVSSKNPTSTVNSSIPFPTEPPVVLKPLNIKTAPMPTRAIANKSVTIYSWATLENLYGKNSPTTIPSLFYKEFGVKFKMVFCGFDTYWVKLATLKAANDTPDLIMCPNWNFFPIGITSGIVQPLDDLIDFTNPIWNDTSNIRQKCKMYGKTYFPFMSETIMTWMFINNKMFRDNGVKTPRQYYDENNWTWETMKELAIKFAHKGPDGEADQWGVGFQTNDLIATTGMELIEVDPVNNYKFNLKDVKVANMMNMLYELGQGGKDVLADGYGIDYFRQGKLAMMAAPVYLAYIDFNTIRLAGNLDWLPMPKMNKSTSYYHQTQFDPGYAIATGAKNPQAAALFIEWIKWYTLGSNQKASFIPPPAGQETAAGIRYASMITGPRPTPDPLTTFSAEEIEKTRKMIDYPTVTNLWQSWLGKMVIPGYAEVLFGQMKWSAAVEAVYPENDAILKDYFNN